MPVESSVASGVDLHAPRRGNACPPFLRFPVVLAALLVVLTVLTTAHRFNDPDLWWHLKTGEVIWTTHAIPQVDLFSYTAGGHHWTAHEWLPQLTLFLSYRLGGYSGIMLWLCVIGSALFVILFVLCRSYSGQAMAGLIGVVSAWFFATVGLAARPLLLGHLLLVLELLLLYLGRTRDKRWLWALPPVFVLWVNSHGSFLLGLVVLGITVECSFITVRAGQIQSSLWTPAARKMLLVTAALCIFALLVNPSGVKPLVYPFDVFLNQKVNLSMVEEWAPLTIEDPRGIGVLAFGALLFFAAAAGRRKLYLDELSLAGFGMFIAFRHSRLLFAFGLLAAPVISRLFAEFWYESRRKQEHPILNVLLLASCAWLVVTNFPSQAALRDQVRKENPEAAVAFIRNAGLNGNLLNEYVWGGYLIWTIPEHKVFIDGRADLHEWAGVLPQFGKWAKLNEDPRLLLERYDIRFCLLRTESPMTRVLPYLPGWQEAYRDKIAVVFVRRDDSRSTVSGVPAKG